MDFLIGELENIVDLKSESNYSVDKVKSIIGEIFHIDGKNSTNLKEFFTSSAPISNRSVGHGVSTTSSILPPPQTGSIVSEIAELDNIIKLKELDIGTALSKDIDHLTKIVSGNRETSAGILSEVDTCLADLSSLTNKQTNKELEQEFNDGLEYLKEVHDITNGANVPVLLNNLEELNNRILEIPTLVNRCIKTGHYNEALMLQQHCKYALKSRFIGYVSASESTTTTRKNSNTSNTSNINTRSINFDTNMLINKIVDAVDNEIKNKMMYGLINLLESVEKFNILKKILNYLINIENETPVIIASIFLIMRFKYIEKKLNQIDLNNGSVGPSTYNVLRRKIDLMREEMYSTITIYNNVFGTSLVKMPGEIILHDYYIPTPMELVEKEVVSDSALEQQPEEQQLEEQQPEGQQPEEQQPEEQQPLEQNTQKQYSIDSLKNVKKPTYTNVQLLEFINKCLNLLFKEYLPSSTDKTIFTESILLQLIYCSFRLNDINVNYHNLMLNKILNLGIYDKTQLIKAIEKKTELSLSF